MNDVSKMQAQEVQRIPGQTLWGMIFPFCLSLSSGAHGEKTHIAKMKE